MAMLINRRIGELRQGPGADDFGHHDRRAAGEHLRERSLGVWLLRGARSRHGDSIAEGVSGAVRTCSITSKWSC